MVPGMKFKSKPKMARLICGDSRLHVLNCLILSGILRFHSSIKRSNLAVLVLTDLGNRTS